ncbi:hypothetical protein [Meiothermus rufus]|nr:hypothetical protein [Meiothermus rufus]
MQQKKYTAFLLALLPWRWLLVVLEVVNGAVDLRLWREEAGRGR